MESQLLSCLLKQKWRLLRAISHGLELPFDSNLSVSEAAEHVSSYLLDDHALAAQWEVLSREGRSAWRALLEAEGVLRREDFCRRFGSIRPYLFWRPGDPPAPWRRPQSPAEEII